ncbi:MAG: hypothetical protein H8E67_04235 [Proteobacteria bacterium]|jgi:hypothetical protein|nr:hypothetical protein [Pseudomonadota bacterium]MBT5795327.1 hypothetical protein [Deltaproteobacteria bacterium]
MIHYTSATPVGILGLGFLGKILAAELTAFKESWGTWHEIPPPEPKLQVFHFDWADENSWTNLPETAVTLVLTIPPLLKNPQAETERLQFWGTWMQQNRPQLKRLIYISTTGVYPKRNEIWTENSEFEADTDSGKLRLLTENVLCQYFQLQIIRPGGIYGCGRGIDFRLKAGKPIPLSSTPVHRIHVEDLARIVLHLVKHPESTTCVNAVDHEAKPSWKVARWLIENRDDLTQEMFPENTAKLPGTPQRIISNQRLLELAVTLRYPTFRQGMV